MEHKADIMTAVAMPKQFLWAPFEMAIVNITLSLAFMIVCLTILNWTPVVSLVPLVIGQTILIGLGTRNPHLTTTLQASGKYPARRRNLVAVSKGVKFVP